MLSQKARYALRALLHLARHKAPVSVAAIAEAEGIPKKFLELILLGLKGRGIVISSRGKFGGYRIARTPDEISFAEVIRAVDGPLALVPCASRTAFRRCTDCPNPQDCEIRAAMIAVRDASAKILESRSLADGRGRVRGRRR